MKSTFAFLLILICAGCCTKKKCLGEQTPYMFLDFSGVPHPGEDKAMLYELENNVITDSTLLQPGVARAFMLPFESAQASTKSFVIKWNGKTETFSNFTCTFREEKVTCNTCFLFIPDKETITKFDDFAYRNGAGEVKSDLEITLSW